MPKLLDLYPSKKMLGVSRPPIPDLPSTWGIVSGTLEVDAGIAACFGMIPGVVPEPDIEEARGATANAAKDSVPVALESALARQGGYSLCHRPPTTSSGYPDRKSAALPVAAQGGVGRCPAAAMDAPGEAHSEARCHSLPGPCLEDMPKTFQEEALQQLSEYFGEGMFFHSGEVVVKRESMCRLHRAADVLKQHPSLALIVKGYTAKPSGKWQTSSLCAELARRRANAVLEALRHYGCSNKIVAEGVGFVDALGSRCEVVTCSLAEALAREEEILLAGQVPEMTGSDDEALAKLEESFEEPPELAVPPVLVNFDPVLVEFDPGDGAQEVVAFTRKPWGICFDPATPSLVTHVEQDSHAHELGVRAGWVFKTIGGRDVSDLDADAMFDVFDEAVRPLPEV